MVVVLRVIIMVLVFSSVVVDEVYLIFAMKLWLSWLIMKFSHVQNKVFFQLSVFYLRFKRCDLVFSNKSAEVHDILVIPNSMLI